MKAIRAVKLLPCVPRLPFEVNSAVRGVVDCFCEFSQAKFLIRTCRVFYVVFYYLSTQKVLVFALLVTFLFSQLCKIRFTFSFFSLKPEKRILLQDNHQLITRQ